jgi:hypothetical protein
MKPTDRDRANVIGIKI